MVQVCMAKFTKLLPFNLFLCLSNISFLSFTAKTQCFESLFLVSRSPSQPQETLSCQTVTYFILAKCLALNLSVPD